SRHRPVKRQVLQVPNTFNGIAWHPGGQAFYVTGGVDDNVHVFAWQAGAWRDEGPSGPAPTPSRQGNPIALGHTAGHGLTVRPMPAGVAVNASGTQALVANFENDSVSVIDLARRAVVTEVDLRPGKVNPAQQGVAGGEYPFWVAIAGDHKAYVSSQRDPEVVGLDLVGAVRLAAGGAP